MVVSPSQGNKDLNRFQTSTLMALSLISTTGQNSCMTMAYPPTVPGEGDEPIASAYDDLHGRCF